MRKEAFSQIRRAMDQVAAETNSTLRINRIGRVGVVTFELIPDGSAYGPMVRVNNAMMNDQSYINEFMASGSDKMKAQVNSLKEKMKDW